MPKGYFFAEIEITDPEIYRHYMPLVEDPRPAGIASMGGKLPFVPMLRMAKARTTQGTRCGQT